MNKIKEFPDLYKAVEGETNVWRVWVEHDEGSHPCVVSQYGRIDGQLQTARRDVEKGKNAGKKNATTPVEQALFEANAEWIRQRDRKHYGETRDESRKKRSEAPMLALDFKEHAKAVEWRSSVRVQKKHDGFRLLAKLASGGVKLVSRQGREVLTVPHIAEDLKKLLPACAGETLDGELYCHGMPFQAIASAAKKAGPDTPRLQYHVYDLVADEPFEARNRKVRRIFADHSFDSVVEVETVKVASEDELMVYQALCIDKGYEGAMLRHGPAGYEAGKRSKSLLKVKTFDDAEFLVVDVRQGVGTYSGAAILICQTEDRNVFEATAPGDMAAKREVWANRSKYIGRQVTIKYHGLTTTSKPVPRFPVAKAFKEHI